MRIGILVPSIGNFGQKGFYNLQEVGLAKALDIYCSKIRVWRLIPEKEKYVKEKIADCKTAVLELIPAKQIGTHGIVDFEKLDKEIDVLICFSDTQLVVPAVYHWTKKNAIKFIPYIGVVKSNSVEGIKQKIMNALFFRNLRVYRKSYCLTKTPAVCEELKKTGVKQVMIAPIGLDISLLKKEYEKYDISMLKQKHGYKPEDKVLLFIGRLMDEKQPTRMVEIFSDLVKKDNNYKLLMIGSGILKNDVEKTIHREQLDSKVQLLDRIPNKDIWELYRFAEAFVNLNQHEIWGMAILEAMYYGCKVVAWNAPGPDSMIENGVSGWIVENNQQVIEKIEDITPVGKAAHVRIMDEFLWETTATKIYSVLEKNMNLPIFEGMADGRYRKKEV